MPSSFLFFFNDYISIFSFFNKKTIQGQNVTSLFLFYFILFLISQYVIIQPTWNKILFYFLGRTHGISKRYVLNKFS